MKFWIFCICLLLFNPLMGGIESANYTDEAQTAIEIHFDGKTTQFKAEKGKFWDHLIVTGDKKKLFFVQCRGDKRSGAWNEDLRCFSVEAPVPAGEEPTTAAIPLKTELSEASIMNIYDVSADGNRLLIELHYCYEKGERSRKYRTFPYFLDPKDGSVTPVKP
jgi:hypothetical protein